MSTVVSASVTAKILDSSKIEKFSTFNEFTKYHTMLNMDYVTYRNEDHVRGYSYELSSVFREGADTPLQPVAKNIDRYSVYSVNTTFTESIDSNGNTVYSNDVSHNVFEATDSLDVKFMPVCEILSDANDEGLIDVDSPYGKKNNKTIKRMNAAQEELTKQFRLLEDIPEIRDREWKPHHKEYLKDSRGTKTEQEYRELLVEDLDNNRKSNKDITDVGIGYIGRFDDSSHIMPYAMFNTYLDILRGNSSSYIVVKEEETEEQTDAHGNTITVVTQEEVKSNVRSFSIQNNLFYSEYVMSGYELTEYTGKLNSKYIKGYSNVSVTLEEEEPYMVKGMILHSDFVGVNDRYGYRCQDGEDYIPGVGYDENSSFDQMPKLYVTIEVQVSSNKIQRLVLFDLFQETLITGKGKIKLGSSAEQSNSEEDLPFIEAYKNESFIPLTYGSMRKIHLFQLGSLIKESKSLLVQMVNVTKTKRWKSLLPTVLRIASVAVFVFSLGSATTASTLLWAIASQIAVQMAVRYAIRRLVEMGIVDGEFAEILTLAIAVFAVAYGGLDMNLASSVSMSVEATGTAYKEVTIMDSEKFRSDLVVLKAKSDKYEKLIEDFEVTGNKTALLLIVELTAYLNSNADDLNYSVDDFFNRTLSRRSETREVYVR